VTIDIAAKDDKIESTELRKIIYDEIKKTQKIQDQTIDLKEFSLTNLEGKGEWERFENVKWTSFWSP
jgi:hypothetical protein